ncbi:shikimate dehydrogenase [uncultured Clostridium sp.]|uniref:shikimate dehydrogenase n=1 Tax=uncultured Clostridium sp. TaxID=59620 RepID=UPI0025F7200A|nr:shikimate dehydrogenase [uncultured Clostridium sp.]
MEKRISGYTTLIGLLATPIKHTSSPKMHNEAFRYLGLDYAYLAFEVGNEGLEDAVKGLKAMQARGCNVSMPNKTVIHKYLDKLTPAAEMTGAVNTVINDNGVLTGTITDGIGYMRSLKERGFDVVGKKMTIVGAGGAATAIEVQAALDGVKELSIFNRKDEFYDRALETVKIINERTDCKATLFDLDDKEALRREIADSYIFTNATGVGMKPLAGETYIEKDMLRPELIVSDVVYVPAKTRLLEIAEEVGCPTINGLGMMLFQGAEAFRLWTGEEMPIDHMKQFLGIE